ncbi:MAG: glutamate-cysteine ligase family protein [Alphaproteobacteria bacterium]|nr:glutamate-cysteine ligase family protein [Alphaproteobacteria bacterium]
MPYENLEITKKNQLLDYFSNGFKKPADFKVGLEFESFLYDKKHFSTLPYNHGYGLDRPTIHSVLRGFNHKKWQDINEKTSRNTIGLSSSIGNISLEPAGQFEFSSIPVNDVKILNSLVEEFFAEVIPILNKQNIGMYFLGINPKFSLSELPLMPKERYEIMNDYMGRVGTEGRNMMRQTCTLQTNLDYANEADLVKKMRTAMALQPFVAALYANSPIFEGKQTGDLTRRVRVWQNTDSARSGLLRAVFEDDFNIEKYVDYAIMLPMYFLFRDNSYLRIPHITFKDFMTGKYKFKDIKPEMGDFETHLGTIFPDVRLKTYLETRLTDCPDKDYLLSLSALFVGILYDNAVLDEAFNLIKKWRYEDLASLREDIISSGFNANIRGQKVLDILREVLAMAKTGLINRKLGEEIYLTPLENLIAAGKTLAESKIELFNSLNGNVDKFIKEITINK